MRLASAFFLSLGLIGTAGCPAPEEALDAATLPDAFAPDASTPGEDAFAQPDAFVPGIDAFTPTVDAFAPGVDAFAPDAFAPVDAYSAPDAPGPGCACQMGDICQEVAAAYCATFLPTCSGTRPASCPRDHLLYTCDGRLGGTTYYSRYFFDDYAAQARSCEMSGGTFHTTPPPAPTGEACGCQRTASACVEVYGPSACSTLACTAPATRIAGECPSAGALAGECVTVDGQRRISYYGISLAAAQTNCRALTSGDYYWVPAS